MNNELRLTGEWPSPELLNTIPNWENAFDEEGVEGQDESTIRPAPNQSTVDNEILFTAATALLPMGRECPAIIELVDGVAGLNVYLDDQWYRLVRCVDRFNQFQLWDPDPQAWLPEGARSPSLTFADRQVFPLRFVSRLPLAASSSPIKIRILPDGGEEPWD